MDAIIQKASKGNQSALTQLYEENKQKVYFLCQALLRNSAAAIPAATWAFKSAFQAIIRDEVQTEEAFYAYAVKQAASYCKKEVVRKDSRAFRLPPEKNFRISHVNDHYIDPAADKVDNYINCLPATQRFTLVLRLVGAMPASQIAKIIGLEAAYADLVNEAEAENLGKIHRSIQNKGISCVEPTTEHLAMMFDEAVTQNYIPDELNKLVTEYIDSVAAPSGEAVNKKQIVCYIASAVVVVIAMILVIVLAGGRNNTAVDQNDRAGTVISADTALMDMDTEADVDTEDSSADNIEDTAEGDTLDDDATTDTLDTSLIYYADIEIRDYGTITVQLDQASAPITTANFVSLAESGFYDGLTFHRIMEGFMMQGGDPNGNGTGGSDETIVGEFSDNGYENALSHTRGAISMARSNDYDSASSQFFIMHGDNTGLDGQYAAFGYVTEGMDIVDAVCEAAEPTDNNGTIEAEAQPVITSVTIRREAAGATTE